MSTNLVATNGAPYNVIKTLNTTNGTAATTIAIGTTVASFDAVTGAALPAGTVLTDAEALAVDPNLNRLYFINGTSNNPAQALCYIDLATKNAYRYTGYPLETNTGAGYNIDRMTFSPDGYGYALTDNSQDLIRFSIDPTTHLPVITPLGPLTNDPNNGTADVLASNGGDMVADASGKLYLLVNSATTASSRMLYSINPTTRVATALGLINNIPSSGNNAVGVDASGNLFVGGNYQTVYKVDLSTLTAAAISSGTTNIWRTGDYASCAFPSLAPGWRVKKTYVNTTGRFFVLSGDPVQYSIEIDNASLANSINANLYDAIPTYAHYVANSTTMNGVAVADIGGAMPFSVTGGQPVNSIGQSTGVVAAGDKAIIKFTVKTDPLKGVCNQATVIVTDATGTVSNVLSDDPTTTAAKDATCFFSDGILCETCCDPCSTAVNNSAVGRIITAKVAPNPFREEINMQLQSNTTEQVNLRLIDFYGRTVYTAQQHIDAGYNALHINVPSGLAPGVYVLELSAGNKRVWQRKLIKQ